MRVATYNTRHGLPPGRTHVDLDLLARSVAALGADVVGLQEVDRATPRSGGADQAGVVARAAGLHAHFGAAIELQGGEYGNALLTRDLPADVEHLPLPAVGEDRAALFATVEADGTAWEVCVTHLQAPRRGRPHEAPAQLERVLDELERRGAGGSPLLLLGDLNLGPDAVLPALRARGLTAADGGPTFPSQRPRERIDWVACRGAEITAAVVPDIRTSDHRPLVVVVRPDAG